MSATFSYEVTFWIHTQHKVCIVIKFLGKAIIMTAAVVVHICEFSSTAMLLVTDREIPENHGSGWRLRLKGIFSKSLAYYNIFDDFECSKICKKAVLEIIGIVNK